ncbi:MAG TPA: hypothetical protein VMT18_01310 [Planctomycetota bacterium]|nr:hypothetical protein [Planctomycetota bacterium]
MSESRDALTTGCEFLLGRLQREGHPPVDLVEKVEALVHLAQRVGLQRLAGNLQGDVARLKRAQDEPLNELNEALEVLKVDLEEALRHSRGVRDFLRGGLVWGGAAASLLAPLLPIDLTRLWPWRTAPPPGAGAGEGFPGIVHAIQFVIVLVFLSDFASNYRRARRASGVSLAHRLISQFLGWFCLVWACWTLLYGSLALERVVPSLGALSIDHGLLQELVNNLTSLMLLMSFAVLDQPSLELRQGDNRDRTFRRTLWCGLLAVATSTAIYGLTREGNWFGIELSDPERRAAQLPGALFAGIATGLLVGRLDSKYLRVPRGLIGTLYGYAVIQMLWPVIRSNAFPPDIEKALYLAALVGKLALWKSVDHVLAHEERGLRDYIQHTLSWMREEERRGPRWRTRFATRPGEQGPRGP